jgi:hypothetical protein
MATTKMAASKVSKVSKASDASKVSNTSKKSKTSKTSINDSITFNNTNISIPDFIKFYDIFKVISSKYLDDEESTENFEKILKDEFDITVDEYLKMKEQYSKDIKKSNKKQKEKEDVFVFEGKKPLNSYRLFCNQYKKDQDLKFTKDANKQVWKNLSAKAKDSFKIIAETENKKNENNTDYKIQEAYDIYVKDLENKKKEACSFKGLSDAWKEVSEEDKEAYTLEANTYKEKYEQDKEEARLLAISNGEFPEDEPSKPLSSYLKYGNSIRHTFKDKNITEIAIETGKMWSELSEKDKKPFIDAYNKEKAEYKIKYEEWKETEDIRKQKLEGLPSSIKIESDGKTENQEKANSTSTKKESKKGSKKESKKESIIPELSDVDNDDDNDNNDEAEPVTKPVTKVNPPKKSKDKIQIVEEEEEPKEAVKAPKAQKAVKAEKATKAPKATKAKKVEVEVEIEDDECNNSDEN